MKIRSAILFAFSLTLASCTLPVGTRPESANMMAPPVLTPTPRPAQTKASQQKSASIFDAAPKSKASSLPKASAAKTAIAQKPNAKATPAPVIATGEDPNTQKALNWLKASKETYDRLQSYECTINTYIKGPKKTSRTAINYRFAKPLKQRLEVTDCTDTGIIGTKMYYDGGQSIKVRATGVLGMFPINLSVDDDKMLNNRGHRLDQVGFAAMAQRIAAPGTKVELQGQQTVDGRPVVMIKIITTNPLDSGITYERAGIDMEYKFSTLYEMYAGDELVSQSEMRGIKFNTPLSPKAFDI